MAIPLIGAILLFLAYPVLDITPYTGIDEEVIIFIILLGLIIIIIVMVAWFQKPKKRAIYPNCEIDMEPLEDFSYYQCPKCKKNFRDKSQF